MTTWRRIRVFISSTADLQEARQAVADGLAALRLEANRFESWPPTPQAPIQVCLEQVAGSEAVVLLLGARYGTVDPVTGLSVTHLEFRRAMELGLPVFAFLLSAKDRDASMAHFVQEVEGRLYRAELESVDELQVAVEGCFLAHFTTCFREYHRPPDALPVIGTPVVSDLRGALPDDESKARRMLRELVEKGRDVEACALREDALRRFPSDKAVSNLLHMATINLAMQEGDVALRDVRAAISEWEGVGAANIDSAVLYNLGNAYSVLGRKDDAIASFEAAAQNEDCPPQCFVNLGNEYRGCDDLVQAEDAYAEALKRAPGLFQANYCMATLHIGRKADAGQGIAFLERIRIGDLAPEHAFSVLWWTATAELELGRYRTGIKTVESALRLRQDSVPVWELAARLYALARRKESGESQEFLGFWRRFTERFPDCGEGWAELAYSWWHEHVASGVELPDEARVAFENALESGFDDGGLVADRLGHIHQELGDWPAAEKLYRMAVAKDTATFGYCLGVSLVFQDKYAEALPFVQAAATEHQPDALSWFQVGKCQFGLQDYEQAVAAYKHSNSLDPTHASVRYDLGGALYHAGRVDEAREVWVEAIRDHPDHESVSQAQLFLDQLAR